MATIEDFRQLSDSDWLTLLIQSVKEEIVQGLRFPKFPQDTIQTKFVGCSGDRELKEAYYSYDFLKR